MKWSLQKSYMTVSVEVRKTQHKYIIGKQRQTVNEILRETGVSVEMPPLESPSETVTLHGPAEVLGPGMINQPCFAHCNL